MKPEVTDPAVRVAARAGARLRRARYAARMRQRVLAETVGVSQATISRLELGHGSRIPLGTWVRAGAAVGLNLDIALRSETDQAAAAMQLRCHRIVARTAAEGAWSAWTTAEPDDPALTATVLERPERQEAAVISVWDSLGSVPAAIDSLERRLDVERRVRGHGWRVSGVVVVTPDGENRRRLIEDGPAIARVMSSWGDDWLAALRRFRVSMPEHTGMLWTDLRVERLRPRLPYIDCRSRNRRRDRLRTTG